MRHLPDLRFPDPIFLWFVFCGTAICGVKIFYGPKTSAIIHVLNMAYIALKRLLLGLFWDRVGKYFVKICGFGICELAHLGNVRICDSGKSQEFTDLRFSVFKKFAFSPLLNAYNNYFKQNYFKKIVRRLILYRTHIMRTERKTPQSYLFNE